MIRRDLEAVGIPYKTEEGVADFHAAGRHTHITGLLKNRATLAEAMQLSRHSDVKTTMGFAHIGLEDQAKAVNNLPAPTLPLKTGPAGPRADTCLHYACTQGGSRGQSAAERDTDWQRQGPKE